MKTNLVYDAWIICSHILGNWIDSALHVLQSKQITSSLIEALFSSGLYIPVVKPADIFTYTFFISRTLGLKFYFWLEAIFLTNFKNISSKDDSLCWLKQHFGETLFAWKPMDQCIIYKYLLKSKAISFLSVYWCHRSAHKESGVIQQLRKREHVIIHTSEPELWHEGRIISPVHLLGKRKAHDCFLACLVLL